MEPMMLFGESGAFDNLVSRFAPSDRYFSIVDDRNAGCAFIVGSFGWHIVINSGGHRY